MRLFSKKYIFLFFPVFLFFLPQIVIAQEESYSSEAAESMIATGRGALLPVYAPLAKQITEDYKLTELTEGVGIDLGGGPGNLIFELCALTGIHWINADINPNYFVNFFKEAESRGIGSRVSAVVADAKELPFRDNYADIIVSRGSFQFWGDLEKAFSEIIRVLKPDGVAYIGRGFARDMPVETARSVRKNQKGMPNYDKHEVSRELEKIFAKMGIGSYRIEMPEPAGADDVSYGIWIEIIATENNKKAVAGLTNN